MKNLIKNSIQQRINEGSSPAIEFQTMFGDSGHVQKKRNDWSIFFNFKCIMVAKSIATIEKKLNQLGVNEGDFLI